ncbi:aminotransferase class III-fold pyridoxal phosphate-dependent enzyme [Streptomyces griseus]|uniref:aminotransferase class III-fold pyridoxal phosphate-dependent enzyme n=1 Tax=Streptomyces griseus TaxID=1911 RepID=UPI00099D30B4|nr:aminotransferase class III-fold pyridoxal phosphate-dependent enzyme [Streptomyces griseus]
MTEGIPRRQSAREPAARTYARALPIVPVRARGLTVEDAHGRRYLDCLSGAGTLALGHNHPVVLEAIRKVLDSGAPLDVLGLATPVEDAFVTELFHTLPPGLAGHARVRFCGPAGTDAVEAAFDLVRAATGRTGVLAFTGAHHGASADGAFEARVARLPYPQDYRCPFGVGGERGAELAARWTESVLDAPDSDVRHPAGMILEPVQGEGGVIPAPDTWMRRMRRLTTDRSIPLIADESDTGVGRTGAFWAVEHSGVTPDVMVLSKAIGGSLPLAVVVHRADLEEPADPTRLADLAGRRPGAPRGTFRGNQLALAAGTATLAHVRANRLAERAATLGARVLGQLRELGDEFDRVGEVRGRGLMIGVELVDPTADGVPRCDGRPRPEDPRRSQGPPRSADSPASTGLPQPTSTPHPAAPALAAAVQRECLRRGLIVDVGGPHGSVVRLLPPLTITDEQAAAVVDRLTDAVGAAVRAHRDGVPQTGTPARTPSTRGRTAGPRRSSPPEPEALPEEPS